MANTLLSWTLTKKVPKRISVDDTLPPPKEEPAEDMIFSDDSDIPTDQDLDEINNLFSNDEN